MGNLLAQKQKESFTNLTQRAIEAALEAGALLLKGYGTNFSIHSKKEYHNLVTEYDNASEKLIIDFLKGHFPESQFLAEESGESSDKRTGLIWIIDPLDGTVNFAHQIPMFAVSIAAELDGEVISGVIYQPITGELFVAEKGQGAFLNGKKLAVSPISELKKSIIATGFPYNLAENPGHCIEHFTDLLKQGIPIRRIGAATLDLAYTAAGRFEGFFEVALGPWDCAAGILMVEEAGGKVSTWKGLPFDCRSYSSIFASNGQIHTAGTDLLSRSV